MKNTTSNEFSRFAQWLTSADFEHIIRENGGKNEILVFFRKDDLFDTKEYFSIVETPDGMLMNRAICDIDSDGEEEYDEDVNAKAHSADQMKTAMLITFFLAKLIGLK